MENQQPTVTVEQIQAANAQSYGHAIGHLTLRILDLEMQNQVLQDRLAEALALVEAAKEDTAKDDEIAEFTEQEKILFEHIQNLESQLKSKSAMSEAASSIAAEGSDAIAMQDATPSK